MSTKGLALRLLALGAIGLVGTGSVHAQDAPPDLAARSINLEDVPYPYPVQLRPLTLYGQDLRMAYMDVASTGESNGRTVVLLHGMNWFAEYFGETIEVLAAAGFRVVAPDQIGFGRSSKPIIPYSLHDHAANTKALLDDLGIETAAVVGHSMGGMLAQRFAFLYPETVSHLVLVNPIGLTDSRAGRAPRRIEAIYEGSLNRSYASIRRTFERYFVTWKPEYERYIEIHYGWTRSADWPRLAMVRALNQRMISEDPVVHDRPGIRARTLVLSGAEDGANFPELARRIVEAIPDARLTLLEGVGHNPHMEDPGRFFPALVEFLRSEGGDGPGGASGG